MTVFVTLPQVQSHGRSAAGRVHRAATARPDPAGRRLIDSHGRTIRDLRLSITDRCNFRCVYCMDPGVKFAAVDDLMTVGEMERVVRACVGLGVRHVRLTGGEPTVHPRLTEIISMVARVGVDDLAMTTNGSLCTREKMREWKGGGLRRVTFSLDSVTPGVFASMTRAAGCGVEKVLEAIAMAIEEGFAPVKVNAVVIRGRNEGEVPKLARLAREMGFEMRFIEYMPLDSGHHWDPGLLVPATEILEGAREAGELVAMGRGDVHSTSETYMFAGEGARSGTVGIIAPVTRPFCGACSRLRITADGKIRPCLFSLEETDLMGLLRIGCGGRQADRAIEDALLDAVWSKQRGHGITQAGFRQPARPMSAIGG